MASTPDAIQVKMFGSFAVYYNGQRLLGNTNSTTKAMHALQLLLFRGQRGIMRDNLLNTLYADDTSVDPVNNLKVTLSNLRKLLAKATLPESVSIVSRNQHYYFETTLPVVLDVTQFEQLLAQAAAATSRQAQIALLEQAAALYTGDFLPHLATEDWAMVTAVKYQQEYVHCVQQLGQLLGDRNQWEPLLLLATQAAAITHLEEFHCLRIDCLMKLNRFQEAKQVYDQVVNQLQEQYTATPGKELLKLFQQLTPEDLDQQETIQQLSKSLQEDQTARGAYYCSYPSFIDVYHMCQRLLERTGQSAYMLLYTLIDTKGNPVENPQKLMDAAPKLREAIRDSLRRGDSFTQHGRNCFLVLLVGTNRENGVLVADRIQQSYKANSAWGIGLQYSIEPVGQLELGQADPIGWQPL